MDPGPSPRALARPSLQPWLWTLFLALVMAVPVLRMEVGTAPAPLPVLGPVPAFALIDQTGARFEPAQLVGRVWVVDFVFTRCPDVCPRMTERLARLQPELETGVELVSVSVDPAFDTPERLAAFARAHGAESPRWHFLTGDRQQIEGRVLPGFAAAFARGSEDVASITHGVHVALVDGRGRIRGEYDSEDPEALARLVADARRLAADPGV